MPLQSGLARALAGTIALLSMIGVGFAPAALAESSAAVPVIRIDGRGHGHGVGMSQWGAYTMARDGASAADIIGAFYPGTQLGNLAGEVVVVIDRRDHVRVRFPGGGEIRSARSGPQHPGFPVSVAPGATVDIIREPGGYRVTGGSVAGAGSQAVRYSASSSGPQDCVLVVCSPEEEPPPSTTTTTTPSGGGAPAPQPSPSPSPAPGPSPEPAPQPAPAPPPSNSDPVSPSPVWAVGSGGSLVTSVDRGRTYRGILEVTGPPGGVKVRNHLDIEGYLKGMAEVPGTWPAAAVQAQAIAARTYAMRAMRAAGELCDSESCQVYAGTAHESAGQVAAVDATRGVVVTYGNALASTFYSASGGGFAANVAEGFGSDHDVPYLPAHPYKTAHPDEWSLDIALTDVAGRLGYPGTVTAVRVDEVGPSGRPLRMTLEGDAGPVDVDPQDFRRRLGLRSTLFTIRNTDAETAPPPPPPANDPGVVGDTVTSAPSAGDDFRERGTIDPLSSDGDVAMAAPAAPAARTVGLLAVATTIIGLFGLATVRRLARLAPAFVGDGVRQHHLGAPVVGITWSRPEIALRTIDLQALLADIRGLDARWAAFVTATMARWTNRKR